MRPYNFALMFSPSPVTRRRFLGTLGTLSLPATAAPPRFVLQNEPHLQHARALVLAALEAAGMAAAFDDAAIGNELRNLYQISSGATHIDMMPATPERLLRVRQGQLRMIAVPLDRGLLGWRLNFVLASQRDLLAQAKHPEDLAHFTLGQGSGWMDTLIYQHAGIPTKEIKVWRNGEFAQQMQAGYIQLFPFGFEESLAYFWPHFRRHAPLLTIDPHLLIRYPWYRFVWVTANSSADALYAALQQGFAQIVANGRFLQIWHQHKQAPSAATLRRRRTIELPNPFYSASLITPAYRHLLAHPDS